MSNTLRVLQQTSPSRPATDDAPHPWLRALDVFGVPFLTYSRNRAEGRVSASAAALLRGVTGALVVQQADRVVATELSAVNTQLRVGQFAWTRAVGTHGGLTLNVFIAWPPLVDVDAIVVLVPYAPEGPSADQPGELTRREADVARLVGAGLATKEIALRLGISGHTVRHHIERVFTKLGVRSRAALAALLAHPRPKGAVAEGH